VQPADGDVSNVCLLGCNSSCLF